jgi:hypothetical protein
VTAKWNAVLEGVPFSSCKFQISLIHTIFFDSAKRGKMVHLLSRASKPRKTNARRKKYEAYFEPVPKPPV